MQRGRVLPVSEVWTYSNRSRVVRLDSYNKDLTQYERKPGYGNECYCTAANGCTPLGLTLSILGLLLLAAAAVVIPCVVIILTNGGSSNSTSSLTVTVPKRMAFYYGWPSLVQGVSGNLTAAAAIFAQFDLIVFGNTLANASHPDHTNTQTIIGSLNALGKATYGYVDLGVTTSNLSIAQMQSVVSSWAAMGITGIMWDDAGYDYGVTRSRQTTMISYCHSLNLVVMMNAWNPDDVLNGSTALTSQDSYVLESFLISNGAYQNLTLWKIKADKCFAYAASLGVSMACLATSTSPISTSFGSTQQFSQAWFGAAMYGFNYFQATDIYYSSSNNLLNAFSNPSSSYGSVWLTTTVQSDSITHYYRSTNTQVLNIYGDGATYGSGNFSYVSSG